MTFPRMAVGTAMTPAPGRRDTPLTCMFVKMMHLMNH